MLMKLAVLETLMITPEPRARIARPAAPASTSTARIITSMAWSCGAMFSLVSFSGTPKPALLIKMSIGWSASVSRSTTRWVSDRSARSAITVSTATP